MRNITKNTLALLIAVVGVSVFAGAALAQSAGADSPSAVTGWIATAIVGVVMLGAGWGLRAAQAKTESWAAPRRNKAAGDRTLADTALIELDKKVDLINIDILERFVRSFVLARLPMILARVPTLGPIIVAAEMAQDAMKEWQHRNPGTQRDMGVTLEAMKGKLAGAVGEQAKDVLTEALIKSGVPKEWTDAATKAGEAVGAAKRAYQDKT